MSTKLIQFIQSACIIFFCLYYHDDLLLHRNWRIRNGRNPGYFLLCLVLAL